MLKRRSTEERVEAYFAAYDRMPDENDEDFTALEKVGLEDLADDEDWP